MKRLYILGLIVMLLASACKHPAGNEPEEFDTQELPEMELSEVKEVIYSMYLPTDLANILERSGANFDPSLPAPVEDIQLYTDREQVAIMLGVYGVDLSYMKILEQPVMAGPYFKALEQLAGKAGIPANIFEASSARLEKNLGNQDSLTATIQDIYMETDLYFRENGKEDLMALSLLGGWIEAMYIGTGIYESEAGSSAMAEKILQQKFSLNSVIAVLSKHQDSLLVSRCILMLKRLKKHYDNVQIMYEKDGFRVDTTGKRILSNRAYFSYDEETLREINSMIRQIRWELIKTEV